MSAVPAARLVPVGRWVAMPSVAAALLGWWLVGDVSERGGEDQLFQVSLAQDHSGLLGLLGVVLAAIVAIELRTRHGEWFRDRAATVALAAVGGVLVGAGLNVVTAKVNGANIGGALVLYVGPFVVVPLLALAVARATRQ